MGNPFGHQVFSIEPNIYETKVENWSRETENITRNNIEEYLAFETYLEVHFMLNLQGVIFTFNKNEFFMDSFRCSFKVHLSFIVCTYLSFAPSFSLRKTYLLIFQVSFNSTVQTLCKKILFFMAHFRSCLCYAETFYFQYSILWELSQSYEWFVTFVLSILWYWSYLTYESLKI